MRRRVAATGRRAAGEGFFWRQESPSMSITRQCWVKRSTSAPTHAAPGKIVPPVSYTHLTLPTNREV